MHKNKHFLYPGNLFLNKSPYIVNTILGSCVSVCLWDSRLKMGAINHYLLPLWNGRGLQSPKYGNIAIEKLINKILETGSSKKDLKAKLFGGASVLDSCNNSFQVGEQNIIIAQYLLERHKIPIISSSVGGTEGLKLIFHTDSGVVLIKRIIKS